MLRLTHTQRVRPNRSAAPTQANSIVAGQGHGRNVAYMANMYVVAGHKGCGPHNGRMPGMPGMSISHSVIRCNFV